VSSVHVHRRARPTTGLAYARLLVPVLPDDDGDVAVAEACLLASDGGTVVVVAPVDVELERPLEVPDDEVDSRIEAALGRARALGLVYGVDVRTRVVRTRSVAATIVDQAESTGADAIVLHVRRNARLGKTVEHVLRHARCRVLLATT